MDLYIHMHTQVYILTHMHTIGYIGGEQAEN